MGFSFGSLGLFAVTFFLPFIQGRDLRLSTPAPLCKDGKFYEDSVFDYLSCSHCLEQSHYSNCNVCCSATVNSKTTTPTPLKNNPPPSTIGSNTAGSFPNQVATKMKIFIILGFLLVGFVAVFLIAALSVFAVKCYRKKKKWKIASSNVKLGMQETQLSTSSPMIMGHPLGEAVPQSVEISEGERV